MRLWAEDHHERSEKWDHGEWPPIPATNASAFVHWHVLHKLDAPAYSSSCFSARLHFPSLKERSPQSISLHYLRKTTCYYKLKHRFSLTIKPKCWPGDLKQLYLSSHTHCRPSLRLASTAEVPSSATAQLLVTSYPWALFKSFATSSGLLPNLTARRMPLVPT